MYEWQYILLANLEQRNFCICPEYFAEEISVVMCKRKKKEIM